jgi:hypothetical protein
LLGVSKGAVRVRRFFEVRGHGFPAFQA